MKPRQTTPPARARTAGHGRAFAQLDQALAENTRAEDDARILRARVALFG